MATLYILGVLLSFLLLFQGEASAEESGQQQQRSMCAPTEEFAKFLTETHGESVIFIAASVRGHIVQVWANPESGGWTASTSFPNGTTCVVDAGKKYEFVVKKKGQAL